MTTSSSSTFIFDLTDLLSSFGSTLSSALFGLAPMKIFPDELSYLQMSQVDVDILEQKGALLGIIGVLLVNVSHSTRQRFQTRQSRRFDANDNLCLRLDRSLILFRVHSVSSPLQDSPPVASSHGLVLVGGLCFVPHHLKTASDMCHCLQKSFCPPVETTDYSKMTNC